VERTAAHALQACGCAFTRKWARAGGYDNLRDHWQILTRHRKTLLSFLVAGLVGAILISLIQTPIYTACALPWKFKDQVFMEQKGPNDSGSNYASPESYVENQVKLLQSESLLEHVIDKLKLQNEQPKTGCARLPGAFTGCFNSPMLQACRNAKN